MLSTLTFSMSTGTITTGGLSSFPMVQGEFGYLFVRINFNQSNHDFWCADYHEQWSTGARFYCSCDFVKFTILCTGAPRNEPLLEWAKSEREPELTVIFCSPNTP